MFLETLTLPYVGLIRAKLAVGGWKIVTLRNVSQCFATMWVGIDSHYS